MKIDIKTPTEDDIPELCRIYGLSNAHLDEMIRGRKLNILQAAKMLGVEKNEIYRLIAAGEIIAFRLRLHYRVPEKSVIDYISRKMLSTARE